MNALISFTGRLLVGAALLGTTAGSLAQAPAGSTGQCNDGSYTSATQKWQACRGHKGVKSWFTGAGGASPVAPATSAAPAAPAQAPTSSTAPANSATAATTASGKRVSPTQRAAAMQQAPGGGGGKVWVNTDSKVYHCEGSTFYGKTKAGQYMTEADAKAAGAKPASGKACSK